MTLDSSIAALGDSTRREILRRLAVAPLRAGDLASGLSVSHPAISKHTRLLARAVHTNEKKWPRTNLKLAPCGGHLMSETIGALKEMERYWEDALHAVKSYAEKKMIIRKSLRVEQPQPITFRIFCDEIGQWWPIGPSFNSKPLAEMVIEGRIGGRFYERYVDGTEYEIGRITTYQPPRVVAFTWRAPSWEFATQVEVRFMAEGEGTRVEVEHSGWEQAEALRRTYKSYETGWILCWVILPCTPTRPLELCVGGNALASIQAEGGIKNDQKPAQVHLRHLYRRTRR